MADIALAVANKLSIEESIVQDTHRAGEDLTAGNIVNFDAAGDYVKAAASADESGMYGIVRRTVVEGDSVTAVRKGVVEGFDLDALAYGDFGFSSATAGAVADTAGTGTYVGRVIPGRANRASGGPDKLFYIDL